MLMQTGMKLVGALSLATSMVLATAAQAGLPPAGDGIVVGGDFNDDGNGDNAYQGAMGSPAAGQVRVQLHDGLSVVDQGFVPDGGGAWRLRAACDATGDGKADLVFEGADGSPAAGSMRVVPMDGVTALPAFFSSTGGGIWNFFGCGDINGDGTDDLVYTGEDGSSAFGFIRVDRIVSSAVDGKSFFPTGGDAFDLAGIGDPDGDGDADFFLEGNAGTPAEGFGRVTLSDGSVAGFVGTAGGDFEFREFGDADGDGAEDLLFEGVGGAVGTSRFTLSTSGTGVPGSNSFVNTGAAFAVFGLADVDNDGDADIVLAGATTNKILVIENAAVDSQTFPGNSGGAASLVRLVDLNGDSQTDLGSDVGTAARFQIISAGTVSDVGDVSTAGGAWELLAD